MYRPDSYSDRHASRKIASKPPRMLTRSFIARKAQRGDGALDHANAPKAANFLNFDSLIQILSKFLSKELVAKFEGTYSVKNGQRFIQFPSRKLDSTEISKPNSQIALERTGYRLNQNSKFYQFLKEGNFIVTNMKDFNLYILSVFYFLSGEAFNSHAIAKSESYYTRETGTQIIIGCKKCENEEFKASFSAEFSKKTCEITGEPINISSSARGTICHNLHYQKFHEIQTTSELNGAPSEDCDFMLVDNTPLLQSSKSQRRREEKSNKTKMKK